MPELPKNAEEAFKQIDDDLKRGEGKKAHDEFVADYNHLTPLEQGKLRKKFDSNTGNPEDLTALELEFEENEIQKRHSLTHKVSGPQIHGRELPGSGASPAEVFLAQQTEKSPPDGQNLAKGVEEKDVADRLHNMGLDKTSTASDAPRAPEKKEEEKAPERKIVGGLPTLPKDMTPEEYSRLSLVQKENLARDLIQRLYAPDLQHPGKTMMDELMKTPPKKIPGMKNAPQEMSEKDLLLYATDERNSQANRDTARYLAAHWDDPEVKALRAHSSANKVESGGKKALSTTESVVGGLFGHRQPNQPPQAKTAPREAGTGNITRESIAEAAGYEGDPVHAMDEDRGHTRAVSHSGTPH